MKSYTVIGLGRFGTKIACKLYEYGEDVLAIDTNEAYIDGIADLVTRAAVADAKDIENLKSLGVNSCDCAVVAIGSDIAASVLITMNLKNLGVPYIICKAYDETHSEILKKLGADRIIIPEHEVAEKTARMMSSPDIFENIELSEEYGITEIKAPRAWIGKTIKDINIRANYGVSVIGIKKGGKTDISPRADHIIEKDSVIILLGDYSSMEALENI